MDESEQDPDLAKKLLKIKQLERKVRGLEEKLKKMNRHNIKLKKMVREYEKKNRGTGW